MRGALSLPPLSVSLSGIIPAYAGSTNHTSPVYGRTRDHPRVCGEHRYNVRKFFDDPGSSPRMRGAQRGAAGAGRDGGIIPAYAGSTEYGRIRFATQEDHPRVCGEHRHRRGNRTVIMGSSPRMRGALRHELRASRSGGIIPAYAGSTFCSYVVGCTLWDHPRVCGEHGLSFSSRWSI